jgi:hypothetical protein
MDVCCRIKKRLQTKITCPCLLLKTLPGFQLSVCLQSQLLTHASKITETIANNFKKWNNHNYYGFNYIQNPLEIAKEV